MNTFDQLTTSVRDHLDDLARGWQHLWQRARRAITPFTPLNHADQRPEDPGYEAQPDSAFYPRQAPAGNHIPSRWGLLTADVIEHADTLEVRLEAPGMQSDDFTLSVSGQDLTIGGKKHLEQHREEGRYHIMERAYGRFERHILLPTSVDDQGARASYKHGVLRITLPKTDTGTRRRIKID